MTRGGMLLVMLLGMLLRVISLFQLDRYIPVSRVKFYFAVTTDYVVHKLVLLLFPFLNKVFLLFFF